MRPADSRAAAGEGKATLLWELLKAELSPYPARWSLATRMAVSCALVMAIEMTFRIPGAALGAYFPFLMPRDSFPSTWRAVKTTVVTCALGTTWMLLAAALFAGSPLLHFGWVAISLFAVFAVISRLTVSSASIGLGLMTAGGIGIWDGTGSASARVNLTLYLFLSVLIGCGITALVEFAFSRVRHRDVVVEGIRVRARLVRRLLKTYVDGNEPSPLLRLHLVEYTRRGTGHLRDVLGAANYDQESHAQIAEALFLSHELVSIGSTMAGGPQRPSHEDRFYLRVLMRRLKGIDDRLRQVRAPFRVELPSAFHTSRSFPALGNLERTIDLLADAFTEGNVVITGRAEGPLRHRKGTWGSLFREGPHAQFAIRGGLSALLCYLFYMSAGWKGLNASIITCFLTALTSVGVTRQRQLLRLLGVAAGGCLLGMGSQALVLPRIETLPEFAILFGACIWMCAWVATSSARLAFAGAQMALAYTLVTLSSFGINTSLIPVRDALLGIVLGLAAMWLIYDHLWAVPSVRAHKRTFVQILKCLGAVAKETNGNEIHRAREWATRAFDDLWAFTDSRVFEPHAAGEQEEQQVDRLQEWQGLLGSISLTLFGLLEQVAARGAQEALARSARQEAGLLLEEMARMVRDGDRMATGSTDLTILIQQIEVRQHEEALSARSLTELRLSHALLVLLRECHAQAMREQVRSSSEANGSPVICAK